MAKLVGTLISLGSASSRLSFLMYSCNSLVSRLSFLQVAVVGLCTQRSITSWIIKSKFQILKVLYAVIFSSVIISVVFVSSQCCRCSDMTLLCSCTLIHRASSDAFLFSIQPSGSELRSSQLCDVQCVGICSSD
jgi:hypothetical protein